MEDIDFAPSHARSEKETDVKIDFDGAAAAWAANKVRKGAMFYYRCTAIQKNGCRCPKAVMSPDPSLQLICKSHARYPAKNSPQAPPQTENQIAEELTHAFVSQ
jgi:hypothetical protein